MERMAKRHAAAFRAEAALEALEGEQIVTMLAARFEVHLTLIHWWSDPWTAIGQRTMASALLDDASPAHSRPARRTRPRGRRGDDARVARGDRGTRRRPYFCRENSIFEAGRGAGNGREGPPRTVGRRAVTRAPFPPPYSVMVRPDGGDGRTERPGSARSRSSVAREGIARRCPGRGDARGAGGRRADCEGPPGARRGRRRSTSGRPGMAARRARRVRHRFEHDGERHAAGRDRREVVRRSAVAHLTEAHGVSRRRACAAMGSDRSSVRRCRNEGGDEGGGRGAAAATYRSVRPDGEPSRRAGRHGTHLSRASTDGSGMRCRTRLRSAISVTPGPRSARGGKTTAPAARTRHRETSRLPSRRRNTDRTGREGRTAREYCLKAPQCRRKVGTTVDDATGVAPPRGSALFRLRVHRVVAEGA